MKAARESGSWAESDCEIPVPLCVDGRFYFVGLRLDHHEHARRQELRLGAATSSGLLHSLWELPHGVPIPRRALAPMDRETLETEGRGWVVERREKVVRVYRPAGVVGSVAVSDKSLCGAVHKVGTHPPTVRRTAVWMTPTHQESPRVKAILSRARRLGVGVLAASGGQLHELVPPAKPIRGRPVVFRWWQAELAYRNWLRSTEPTDTAGPSA